MQVSHRTLAVFFLPFTGQNPRGYVPEVNALALDYGVSASWLISALVTHSRGVVSEPIHQADRLRGIAVIEAREDPA